MYVQTDGFPVAATYLQGRSTQLNNQQRGSCSFHFLHSSRCCNGRTSRCCDHIASCDWCVCCCRATRPAAAALWTWRGACSPKPLICSPPCSSSCSSRGEATAVCSCLMWTMCMALAGALQRVGPLIHIQTHQQSPCRQLLQLPAVPYACIACVLQTGLPLNHA